MPTVKKRKHTRPVNDLDFKKLLDEVQLQSKKIVAVLKETPGDVIGHKLFQKYSLLLHTILQGIVRVQSVDRSVLLGDALSEVVCFLLKHDLAKAAKCVGENLEDISASIQKGWDERRKSI